MREIKFRYWYKNTKEMAYDIQMVFPVLSDHPIIMQYTGLKDKNGKEIYEGDIDSDGMTFEYLVDMAGWYRMKNGEGVQWHEQAVKKGRLPFEIIGNIYENPELIEKGNASTNPNQQRKRGPVVPNNYVWVVESRNPTLGPDFRPEINIGPFATKNDALARLNSQLTPVVNQMKFRIVKYEPAKKGK